MSEADPFDLAYSMLQDRDREIKQLQSELDRVQAKHAKLVRLVLANEAARNEYYGISTGAVPVSELGPICERIRATEAALFAAVGTSNMVSQPQEPTEQQS